VHLATEAGGFSNETQGDYMPVEGSPHGSDSGLEPVAASGQDIYVRRQEAGHVDILAQQQHEKSRRVREIPPFGARNSCLSASEGLRELTVTMSLMLIRFTTLSRRGALQEGKSASVRSPLQ